MKLLGRHFRLKSIPRRFRDFSLMIVRSIAFQKPISLWTSYLSMRSPSEKVYALRNGYKIHLSDNPHDSITVMVIFCRNEYGPIPKGGTVIDIGANIGAFSMFAASKGAAKVYSFEPNRESFRILEKNIAANGLNGVVFPFNLAVTERDKDSIKIAKSASPYNRIMEDTSNAEEEFDFVSTISLKSILKLAGDQVIDLCKMDCEGAEYEILYSTPLDAFSKIHNLRMEHHDGSRKDQLVSFLDARGFQKVRDRNITMWFRRVDN